MPLQGPKDSGAPVVGDKLRTERTKLTSDDREDKRQSSATKVQTLPPNSTPSLTNMRRTLPSRALAYKVTGARSPGGKR